MPSFNDAVNRKDYITFVRKRNNCGLLVECD
jgi:hypothetical protein